MAEDNVKNRLLGSFGINPDNPPTLKNTVSNIKQKGLLGSIAQGAKDTYNTLATQSTNFGKQYIEGGKNVLFGIGSDPQRTQGGQVNGGGVGNTNNSGNTGVVGSVTTQQVSPQNLSVSLGSTKIPEPIRTVTQSNSSLNINNRLGGTGSISFQDGRTLSPEKINTLEKDINYNSLQSTKDKFAKEAEIVAQRRSDAEDFMRFRSLPPQARAMAQAKYNIDRGELAAKRATSDIASNRLGFDANNALADQLRKDRETQYKQTQDTIGNELKVQGLIQEDQKNLGSNPISTLSKVASVRGLKRADVFNVFGDKLKGVNDRNSFIKRMGEIDGLTDDQGLALADLTYPE